MVSILRKKTFGCSPDNRLLRADQEDNGIVFDFEHDDSGQREIKYRNGEMVEAYAWLDFLRLAGFHDGDYAYRFAYEDGERTPYALQREDGAVAYLFYDQVGSLRVVADESGNVIKEVLYDPFGGIIEDSNPNMHIPIGFAGGLHDRDLGFVRFGWRDYDTFTSRWTAPDPMGDAGVQSEKASHSGGLFTLQNQWVATRPAPRQSSPGCTPGFPSRDLPKPREQKPSSG